MEEDIFHELIEGSPHLCLTVRCPEDNISAGLSEGKYIITLKMGQMNTFTFTFS